MKGEWHRRMRPLYTCALNRLFWRRCPNFAACAIMVAITGSAIAATIEDPVGMINQGLSAANRGDYATALRLWKPLAEQGYPAAEYNLGTMYREGNGVPRDYAEVVKWYRQAGDQGFAAARYNLGFMYDNGQGVTQDYGEAAKWYSLAAEQGVAAAQYNLGKMYDKGQGVPRDAVQAYKWFDLAASRYLVSEREERSRALRDRDNLAFKLTPAQLADAQKLVRLWRPN